MTDITPNEPDIESGADATVGPPTEPVPVVDLSEADASPAEPVVKAARPTLFDEITRLVDAGIAADETEAMNLIKEWYQQDPPIVKIDKLTPASPSRAGLREHVAALVQQKLDDDAHFAEKEGITDFSSFQRQIFVLTNDARAAFSTARRALARQDKSEALSDLDRANIAVFNLAKYQLDLAILTEGRRIGISDAQLTKSKDAVMLTDDEIANVFALLDSEDEQQKEDAQKVYKTFWFVRMSARCVLGGGNPRKIIEDFSFPGQKRPVKIEPEPEQVDETSDGAGETSELDEPVEVPEPTLADDSPQHGEVIIPDDEPMLNIADVAQALDDASPQVDEPAPVGTDLVPVAPRLESFWEGMDDDAIYDAALDFFADDDHEAASPYDAMRHLSDRVA